ncbi:uncharacterized protein LOC124909696 [Impatiens glandulifera]|uniref:uncharacterized protein LOC124909696 n=1 Tax=Impatiens glandulifera TaxID=253017 RepID=UPI001FB07FB9|nr:uncharacterized protein LOC124909696 [Impatiens glandulifera]
MAREEEVFDFSSKEFTKEDLVTALNDMVIEFKNLSAIVPTRLSVHTNELSNFQTGESSETKTDESTELSYENEKLKEIVQSLTEENERSKYVMAAWKKSSEAVSQISTYQRHPKCKFGIGYKGGKSDNHKHSKELNLNKNKLPFISFVKSSSIDTEADHGLPLTKEINYAVNAETQPDQDAPQQEVDNSEFTEEIGWLDYALREREPKETEPKAKKPKVKETKGKAKKEKKQVAEKSVSQSTDTERTPIVIPSGSANRAASPNPNPTEEVPISKPADEVQNQGEHAQQPENTHNPESLTRAESSASATGRS